MDDVTVSLWIDVREDILVYTVLLDIGNDNGVRILDQVGNFQTQKKQFNNIMLQRQ